MKIAITGASGFIGQYIVAEFERRLISPVLICMPPVVFSPALSKHLTIPIDLKSPPPNSFELMGCPDLLIHLAWGGLPNYKSLHHFEEELPSQYRFLKELIESGLKNILITGTCFEYGMQSGRLCENAQTNPNNPYGFAKDSLRQQLEYLQQHISFNLTWTRLFYLYGDGQSPNSIISQLKSTFEKGETIFNMSGGEQLRDYLHVSEVASHLVKLALTERNNGIVNVCSGVPISIRKLVEGWITQNGWPIKLNLGYYPYPDYEPMAFWGDNTKLECLIKS